MRRIAYLTLFVLVVSLLFPRAFAVGYVSNSVVWDFGFVRYNATVFATDPYNGTLVFFLDVIDYNESIIRNAGLAGFEVYWVRLSTPNFEVLDVYPNITLGELKNYTFFLYDVVWGVNFDVEKDTVITAMFNFNVSYTNGMFTTLAYKGISVNVTKLKGVVVQNIDFTFNPEEIVYGVNGLLLLATLIEAGLIIVLAKKLKVL